MNFRSQKSFCFCFATTFHFKFSKKRRTNTNSHNTQGFSLPLEENGEEETPDGGKTNSSLPDVVVASNSGGGGGGSNTWRLSSVSNPFIGTWISDPDEYGIILAFTGYSDGTFDYEMRNLGEYADYYPSEGTGSYIVRKDSDGTNVMISYFDFDMIKSNAFTVKSNHVIEVTEFNLVTDDVNETSDKKFGGKVNFTREGEIVRSDYTATELPRNIFMEAAEVGWGADFPEPDGTMAGFVSAVLGRDYYSSVWDFSNDGTVVCTFIDFGTLMEAMGMPIDSKDLPYHFSYVVYDDDENPNDGVMIIYTEDESGNQLFV